MNKLSRLKVFRIRSELEVTYNVRDVITENSGLAGSFPQKLERHPPVSLIFHQPPKTVGAKPTNPLTQDQAVNYLQDVIR